MPDSNTSTGSPDSNEQMGVIQSTSDYERFHIMNGNRDVDKGHVARLKKEMEHNRELFRSLPILVNQNWYIVDGQHRFTAAKELGLPIYYIRQSRLDLADTRRINIAQRRWNIRNFAESYATSGRPDYIELLRIWHQYKEIPLSVVAMYLAEDRAGVTDTFQRGEYKIVDKEDGLEALDFTKEIMEICRIHVNKTTASAIIKLLAHDDFDSQVFLRKLREDPDALAMHGSVRAALRNFEEIYNRHNRIPVRLY